MQIEIFSIIISKILLFFGCEREIPILSMSCYIVSIIAFELSCDRKDIIFRRFSSVIVIWLTFDVLIYANYYINALNNVMVKMWKWRRMLILIFKKFVGYEVVNNSSAITPRYPYVLCIIRLYFLLLRPMLLSLLPTFRSSVIYSLQYNL